MRVNIHKIKFIDKRSVVKYYFILLTAFIIISLSLKAVDLSVFKLISFIK